MNGHCGADILFVWFSSLVGKPLHSPFAEPLEAKFDVRLQVRIKRSNGSRGQHRAITLHERNVRDQVCEGTKTGRIRVNGRRES